MRASWLFTVAWGGVGGKEEPGCDDKSRESWHISVVSPPVPLFILAKFQWNKISEKTPVVCTRTDPGITLSSRESHRKVSVPIGNLIHFTKPDIFFLLFNNFSYGLHTVLCHVTVSDHHLFYGVSLQNSSTFRNCPKSLQCCAWMRSPPTLRRDLCFFFCIYILWVR